jgi:uncharacterized protein with HEPN domain
MRNRPVHAYFDVDGDILWTTVDERLPVAGTESDPEQRLSRQWP